MINWLIKIFSPKKEQVKVWAYQPDSGSLWTKVVSYERPPTYSHCFSRIVGPFRSEVDCEEFCDFNNSKYTSSVKKYSRV